MQYHLTVRPLPVCNDANLALFYNIFLRKHCLRSEEIPFQSGLFFFSLLSFG